MKLDQVPEILTAVAARLKGALPPEAESAVRQWLNLVEQLVAEQRHLLAEVPRLQELLDQKKRSKTTGSGSNQPPSSGSADHSSEKQRRKRAPRRPPPATDRRPFKALVLPEERECPLDPQQLPPDARRCPDETLVVQDIRIAPHNIRFVRHVYDWAEAGKFFRGPLPPSYEAGDWGPDLRSLILALKYCGNMSEAKILERLDNFAVQLSFRFDATTRQWLEQGELPPVWQERVAALEDDPLSATERKPLLDAWFGVSAYAYLRDRLLQAHELPRLAILLRTAAAGG